MPVNKSVVMIVEDDKDVAFLLRDVLEGEGCRCLLESEGSAAVQKALLHHPALILLDIKLIGIDGYTVCRRLKKDPTTQSIPVVFISALHSEKDVMEAKEAGGIYFIGKPFEIPFLVQKIKETLSRFPGTGVEPSIRFRIVYVQSDAYSGTEKTDRNLVSLFQEPDLQVHLVRDARETVRKALQVKPDLIILDVDDAVLPAWTVADAVWKNKYTRSIPLAVLTEGSGNTRLNMRNNPLIRAVFQRSGSSPAFVKGIRGILESFSRVSSDPGSEARDVGGEGVAEDTIIGRGAG